MRTSDRCTPHFLAIHRLAGLAALAGLLLFGCRQAVDESPNPSAAQQSPPGNDADGAPTDQPKPPAEQDASSSGLDAEVRVSLVDADGFQSVIAGHLGSVVLVDMWALW